MLILYVLCSGIRRAVNLVLLAFRIAKSPEFVAVPIPGLAWVVCDEEYLLAHCVQHVYHFKRVVDGFRAWPNNSITIQAEHIVHFCEFKCCGIIEIWLTSCAVRVGVQCLIGWRFLALHSVGWVWICVWSWNFLRVWNRYIRRYLINIIKLMKI